MLVQELMTAEPVTVRPETPVKAALQLLDEHSITALPVVTSDGRIAGVVSEADLIRDHLGADPRMHEIPVDHEYDRPGVVADVMTPHAVTVRPDSDLTTAIEIATSTGIKSIPVVDHDDHVVGIVSRRDVVRLLARSDERIEREVDSFLASTTLGDWLVEVKDGVVELTGPADDGERRIAAILARTIPGVVEVRFR
jgi:CBS domain-containing protein